MFHEEALNKKKQKKKEKKVNKNRSSQYISLG
jgi:hypothetical protein